MFGFLVFLAVGVFIAVMVRWALQPEEKGEEVPSDMTLYMGMQSMRDRYDE